MTVLNSGELLLDQSRFQDAVDKFDRAIEDLLADDEVFFDAEE